MDNWQTDRKKSPSSVLNWIRKKYDGLLPPDNANTDSLPVKQIVQPPTKTNNAMDPASARKEMALKFAESVACPICFEVAVPPLIQCVKGHFVCSFCRPKMENCGLCRENFTASRNFAIENIVSTMDTKCIHSGCAEIVKVPQLREHMEECVYKPLMCTHCAGEMAKLIPWEDYPKHLIEVHEYVSVPLTLGKFWNFSYRLLMPNQDVCDLEKQPNLLWPMTILTLTKGSTTFLVNVQAEDSIAFIWIATLSSNEADRYIADIQISRNYGSDSSQPKQKDHFKFMFTISVAPHNMTRTRIKYSRYCATVPLRSLLELSYPNPDGGWTFSVQATVRAVSG